MALLAIACLYLAGLNLWLEFKAWFNERYVRRTDKPANKVKPDQRNTLNFACKSAFNLQEEQFELKQRQKENEEEENERIKKIANNQLFENNSPFKEIALDRLGTRSSVNNQPISSYEDIELDLACSPQDAALAGGQSATWDEIQLLAQSLEGKATNKIQEKEAAMIITKLNGTGIYDQFLNQIQGAEDRASAILRGAANQTAMY